MTTLPITVLSATTTCSRSEKACSRKVFLKQKPDPLATSAFEKPKVHKHTFSQVVHLSSEEEMLFNTLVKEVHLDPACSTFLSSLMNNGQMRRACIVKAVLRKPELSLLDEPSVRFF